MIKKLSFATAAVLFSSLVFGSPASADYKETVKEFRVGLIGGENAQDLMTRNEKFRELLETELGIPVKLYPATDYGGIMQAMGANQVELASLGPSAFAGAWLDCKCVEPLVVPQEADGSTFYYSVMVTRADSGLDDLKKMKGKSLAFADPNSASGYLIPNASLKAEGIDPTTYFSKTGFSGGHEQGVIAVLQKQYDGAVTWVSGQGEKSEGYTRGNLRSMVDKGLLKMADVNLIWQSGKIPNGPITIRTNLPEDLKAKLSEIMMSLPTAHPDIYKQVERGTGKGYVRGSMDIFQDIIKLREAEATGGRKS